MPVSASTKAPASSINSLFSLAQLTVSPAPVVPVPLVITLRGFSLHAYLSSCDFPVPGSPIKRAWILPLTLFSPEMGTPPIRESKSPSFSSDLP